MELQYLTQKPDGNRRVHIALTQEERGTLQAFFINLTYSALSGYVTLQRARSEPDVLMRSLERYRDGSPLRRTCNEDELRTLTGFITRHATISSQPNAVGGIPSTVAEKAHDLAQQISAELTVGYLPVAETTVPDTLPENFA